MYIPRPLNSHDLVVRHTILRLKANIHDFSRQAQIIIIYTLGAK